MSQAPIRSESTAPADSAPMAAPYAPGTPAPASRPGRQPVYATRSGVRPGGLRLIQLVWLAALVVDAVIALDFIFRAVAANNVGFAHYIYRINGWLIAPFSGIFSNTSARGVATLRWSDVLAFVVYTVAAWIVAKLIRIASTPSAGVSTV